jgi:hypothetical protein
VVPEPEGLSPHSQQPANGPYPEPAESNPIHIKEAQISLEEPYQALFLLSLILNISHLANT